MDDVQRRKAFNSVPSWPMPRADAQTTCGDLPLMAGSDNRALAISPPPQISFSYHLSTSSSCKAKDELA